VPERGKGIPVGEYGIVARWGKVQPAGLFTAVLLLLPRGDLSSPLLLHSTQYSLFLVQVMSTSASAVIIQTLYPPIQ
jgi:hypothetical protein